MVTTEVVRKPTTFPYLQALDGLRGLLVFPVVAFHFSLTAGFDPEHILAPGSFFAPSCFFTLSGFLITSLLLTEHERNGVIDGRGFWSRRFRRLLPASMAVVLFAVLVTAVSPNAWGPLPVADVASALFSVQNWWAIHLADTGEAFRLLGPLGVYWSLAVEEQFYLGLFAVVMLASRTRHMTKWLVGMLLAVGAFSITMLVVVDSSPQREFFGTDTRASELVAGCLLAVWVHHRGWPSHRWWGPIGWLALGLTVLAWAFVWEDDPWVLGGGLALASLLNVGMIGGAVVEGSFRSMLSFRPLVELGRLSYPIYLIHWPIALLTNPDRMGFRGWPLMLFRFVVSVAAGYALFRLLERPLRKSPMVRWPLGFAVWAVVVVACLGISYATSGGS